MKRKSIGFLLVDILLLIGIIAPFVFGMVLKVLTTPPGNGIEITGARIYFEIKMPFQNLPITESQVNSWIVIVAVFFLCLYFTHGLKNQNCARHMLAEWLVEKCDGMTVTNMGEFFAGFSPFIAAILALSAFSSLLALLGLYAPTSDINIVGGWAILIFILITYYKMKCGPLHYIKSFGDPVPLLSPLNIISEIATPFSMAFRHYGNVLSGTVISVLIATALQGLSSLLLGWLPGVLGDIPFLQIGIPAVLSIYFDVFSGILQAYIFAMLSMLYISSGFPAEKYFERKNKKISGGKEKC